MPEGEELVNSLQLEEMLAGIDIELPVFFDPLEPVLEYVTREGIRAVLWVVNKLWYYLTWVGSAFWDVFSPIVAAIINSVVNIGSWVVEMAQSGWDWLWNKIQTLLTEAHDTISNVWETVKTTATDVGSTVWGYLVNTISSIANFVQGGINYVGNYVYQIGQWLGDEIEKAKTFFADEIIDPWTDFLGDFVDRIEGAFQIFDPFLDIVRTEGWGTFLPLTGQDWQRGARMIWQWFSDEIGGWVSDFWDSIIVWLAGFAPVSPEKSPDMAKNIMMLGAASVGGLAAMTLGGELMHPLKQIGFGQVAAIIGDVVNYRSISGVILGAILGATLRTPLTYYVNALMRPKIPDVRTLTALAGEYALVAPEQRLALMAGPGGIDLVDKENRRQFVELGKYDGYTDATLNKLYELADTPERYFFLSAVARLGIFDEGYFTRALMNSGYNPETIRFALDMFRRSAAEAVQATGATTAFRRFREGLTDQAGFVSELRMLGYAPDKIQRFITTGELDKQTDMTSDTVSGYRAALRANRITPDDFLIALSGEGITLDRASGYLRQEAAWRGGTLSPEGLDALKGAYSSIAIRAYKEGYHDRDWLITTLQTLSYTQAEIDQTLIRADLEYEVDHTADLVSAYKTAYAKDLIDESEFGNYLAGVIVMPERVDTLVTLETFRKLPKPTVPKIKPPPKPYETKVGALRIRELIMLYQAERINDAELLNGLLELEMPRDQAEASVDYERTRLENRFPPPPVEPLPYYETPAGKVDVLTLREAFRDEAITEDELYTYLLKLEMPETLARSITRYEIQRAIKPPT